MLIPRDSRPRRALSWMLLVPAVVVLCSVAPGTALGERQDPESTRVAEDGPKNGVRLFPPRMSAGGVVYIPKVSYSSETGVGVGGQLLRPFRFPGSPAPTSDVRLKGRITFKGQKELELRSNLKFGDGTYGLKTRLSFSSLPLRFYGFGPDTPAGNEEIYRPQSVLAYVEFIRKIVPQFQVGLRYEYERVKLLEVEAGGLMDTSPIRGKDGKGVFGLGFLMDWDTRDRRFSPTSGNYYQFFFMTFDDEIGSEHDFNVYNLDFRNYFTVLPDHVLATQFFVYSARGAPPFWRLAALGGRAHTRGYRKGRYLDRILVAFQGEYRFPVWRRVGLVVFGGLADVASSMNDLRLEFMKGTVGGGLRFRTRSGEGVNARLDMGVGGESIRFYLGLDESF